MNNEVTVMNNELPKLRQMVFENTERINKNEQTINEMRKRETEEERKMRERNEFWEDVNRKHALARQEHDRDMRELRQMFKENAEQIKKSREEFDKSREEFDRRLAESREKFDREMAESRKKFDRQMAESREDFDRDLEETKKLIKEAAEQIKETSKEVKLLSRQFNGETGHIVEGLVSSSAEKLFQKYGLDLHNCGKNLRRHLKSENMKMEVDVLLSNNEIAVPIEVKTKFTEENLNWFMHQMEMFRKLFPEYADKKVIAAVAAIDYDMDVDTLAHKEGLLVIRVNSDYVFSLDPFDMEKLKRF